MHGKTIVKMGQYYWGTIKKQDGGKKNAITKTKMTRAIEIIILCEFHSSYKLRVLSNELDPGTSKSEHFFTKLNLFQYLKTVHIPHHKY